MNAREELANYIYPDINETIEDLEKAKWYLENKIKILKEENNLG